MSVRTYHKVDQYRKIELFPYSIQFPFWGAKLTFAVLDALFYTGMSVSLLFVTAFHYGIFALAVGPKLVYNRSTSMLSCWVLSSVDRAPAF
jgi:hypothetical protein